MSSMSSKSRIGKENVLTIRIMGIAVIFFTLSVIAYAINYANILNITSPTDDPSKELLNYDYLTYGLIGIIGLTISFLFSLASLSQSKEPRIIVQFFVILIGWIFGIIYSCALIYVFQQGWEPTIS